MPPLQLRAPHGSVIRRLVAIGAFRRKFIPLECMAAEQPGGDEGGIAQAGDGVSAHLRFC